MASVTSRMEYTTEHGEVCRRIFRLEMLLSDMMPMYEWEAGLIYELLDRRFYAKTKCGTINCYSGFIRYGKKVVSNGYHTHLIILLSMAYRAHTGDIDVTFQDSILCEANEIIKKCPDSNTWESCQNCIYWTRFNEKCGDCSNIGIVYFDDGGKVLQHGMYGEDGKVLSSIGTIQTLSHFCCIDFRSEPWPVIDGDRDGTCD